jgi:hypothetical protein
MGLSNVSSQGLLSFIPIWLHLGIEVGVELRVSRGFVEYQDEGVHDGKRYPMPIPNSWHTLRPAQVECSSSE